MKGFFKTLHDAVKTESEEIKSLKLKQQMIAAVTITYHAQLKKTREICWLFFFLLQTIKKNLKIKTSYLWIKNKVAF